MPIICPHCGREFKGSKLNARHLAKCNPEASPKVPPCLCGHEATSLTQMKRHRRVCETWQKRDKKALANARRRETSLERYGVEDARRTTEANSKRTATNRERYGAANPFSKESSVFDKVQESLVGKRVGLKGQDNPFAKPEVQKKIRETMEFKYGAANPQQVPEIRAQTRQTNLERYGHEETLAVPEIRDRIRETCKEKYGGPAPSCDPDVQEKQQETNMDRYGVPWTCMDPEIRRQQLDTMEKNYGSHFFASDEGKKTIRATLKERYGVEFPGAIEGHWDRAVAVFRKRYGVDHPLQLEYFNEKRFKTCLERYGTPFPGRTLKGPNLFERRIGEMAPRFMFTGDGQFWKRLPLLGVYKNPDFILPGPDPKHPFKRVTHCIEAFGDFWHSRMFTGKSNFDHEQELIEGFADIGISCLIIWESELKHHPKRVAERIRRFISG